MISAIQILEGCGAEPTRKRCSKCKKQKETSHFRKDVYSGDGFTCRCKACIKASTKPLSKEQMREKSRRWRKNNPDYSRAYMKAFREGALDQFPRKGKPESISREEAKLRVKAQQAAYIAANPEVIRETKRRSANKPESKRRVRAYNKARLDTDVEFRLKSRLQARIGVAVRKSATTKAARTEQLVGCTVATLRRWLESQFLEGMKWENYRRDGWHIDHIRPCAMFDLTDPEQQRACFHFTNLRPLWASDNLRKNDTFVYVPDYQI